MSSEDLEKEYFTKQILTYMGNKRKFISKIDDIISMVKSEIGENNINIGEGFSGTGIVSRLLKNRVMGDYSQSLKKLYVNDIAGYSNTLNKCYLTSSNDVSEFDEVVISTYITEINNFMDDPQDEESKINYFISRNWAPSDDDDIKEGERVYFTKENANRIDRAMHFLNTKVSPEYKQFLLAPLLIECSIHNNTDGKFASFYKENNIGKYGGKNSVDLKRITQQIVIKKPILTEPKADVILSKKDANDWVRQIPELDLVYYDPPYNKHPYCIYYFLLDIINKWDTLIDVPKTLRGQPKNWIQSPYCSFSKAKKSFEDLIDNTKSKFILISYNNGGIIPLTELEEILKKRGKVYKIPVEHNTYNKLKGIANYKRKKKKEKISEYLWLLDTR
tara:strand:+ start:114 stop:1283 length:1170 start_codon:yes stop_codon:yes gene_type:complete